MPGGRWAQSQAHRVGLGRREERPVPAEGAVGAAAYSIIAITTRVILSNYKL